MLVIHDLLDGEHFIEIVLDEDECEALQEGELFSEEKDILGKRFYVGVRRLRSDENFDQID